MVSFTDFIAALKATRIRRILHSNANWTELLSSELNIIIYNLWIFGIDYINNLTVNNQKVLDRCFKVVQRKKKNMKLVQIFIVMVYSKKLVLVEYQYFLILNYLGIFVMIL